MFLLMIIGFLFLLFKVIGDFYVDKFEKPDPIDGKKNYDDTTILGVVIFFGIVLLLMWLFK